MLMSETDCRDSRSGYSPKARAPRFPARPQPGPRTEPAGTLHSATGVRLRFERLVLLLALAIAGSAAVADPVARDGLRTAGEPYLCGRTGRCGTSDVRGAVCIVPWTLARRWGVRSAREWRRVPAALGWRTRRHIVQLPARADAACRPRLAFGRAVHRDSRLHAARERGSTRYGASTKRLRPHRDGLTVTGGSVRPTDGWSRIAAVASRFQSARPHHVC